MKNTSCSYPIASSLTTAEAGSQWLDQHKRNLKPNTIRIYQNALKSLNQLFGPVIVCKIDIGHILKYQAERSAKAGPLHINYEVFVLQQVLKRAGHWKKLQEFYKPMRVSKRLAGHSLSEEQEKSYARLHSADPSGGSLLTAWPPCSLRLWGLANFGC
jgi:hypothetical protein